MFPVGSLFRLRVSHHLGPATFPAPASSNAACGFLALRSLRAAFHKPPEIRARFSELPAKRNLFRMLANSGGIFPPLISKVSAVFAKLELEPRHHEITILLTGRRTDARYVWEQQLRIAPESHSDTFRNPPVRPEKRASSGQRGAVHTLATREYMRSILVAMMKSFSCSPLIFLVCRETVALPQPKLISG